MKQTLIIALNLMRDLEEWNETAESIALTLKQVILR